MVVPAATPIEQINDLKAAGYVPFRWHRPDQVQVLATAPAMVGTDGLLMAALEALQHGGDFTKAQFFNGVLAQAQEERRRQQAGSTVPRTEGGQS